MYINLKFTKGESSSVTVETAEKLIIAIWYTIDMYLGSCDNIIDGNWGVIIGVYAITFAISGIIILIFNKREKARKKQIENNKVEEKNEEKII